MYNNNDSKINNLPKSIILIKIAYERWHVLLAIVASKQYYPSNQTQINDNHNSPNISKHPSQINDYQRHYQFLSKYNEVQRWEFWGCGRGHLGEYCVELAEGVQEASVLGKKGRKKGEFRGERLERG